jgi:response regulator RpfG family c-di-GMP phosphodiesterase
MNEKILFVDDEENILRAIERDLRKRFAVVTATSAAEALAKMKAEGPFAVIVADMRMPGKDGIQLLAMVKDLYPETIRLMLTGAGDQKTASEAVNKGQIFRFLSKPCPNHVLVPALALALRQYRLVTAEKDILDKTLKGAIEVLSEVLSLANPVAFSSGLRLQGLVTQLAAALHLPGEWQYEVAALLARIGCITVPGEILNKYYAGQPLAAEEEEMYRNHPRVGAGLLEKIPRLETVAAIIAHQFRDFHQLQQDPEIDEDVALAAQVLRIAVEYDAQLHRDVKRHQILSGFAAAPERYNPAVVAVLSRLKPADDRERILSLTVEEMAPGMLVEQDILGAKGALIAGKGQLVTWSLLQGLRNFARKGGVQEPILVRIRPVTTGEDGAGHPDGGHKGS